MIDLTAICVTKGRAEKLRLALNCWARQTLSCNLLLVHQGLEFEPPAHPRLRLVEGASSDTLGELRNRGLDALETDYWAQFDDDDLHRTRRLEKQLQKLKDSPAAQACILSRWMLYDQITDRAWVSWPRLWEGSIVARRTELRYPAKHVGEDTDFVGQLTDVATLDEPELYIYRCHGKNSYTRTHFMGLAARSTRIPTQAFGVEFDELERTLPASNT